MTRIKVIDRLDNDNDFIELTHNSADEHRVYRVEIKTGEAHWDEWFTTLDGDLNNRLARGKFAELKEEFFTRKVMA
jgi:hypothetical protein